MPQEPQVVELDQDAFDALVEKRAEEKMKAAEYRKSRREDADDEKIDAVTGRGRRVESKEAAQPRDYEAKAMAHEEAFSGWLGGEHIDDEHEKLLKPTSERILKMKGAGSSVRLPLSFTAPMFGTDWAEQTAGLSGKTMWSTDDPINNPSRAHNLVPQEFRPVLSRLPSARTILLQQVTRLPTSTGELTIPQIAGVDGDELGGVDVRWIVAGTEKPETESQFNMLTIPCHELAAYTEVTHKLIIRSAIGIDALLRQLFVEAVGLELDRVILAGRGPAFNEPLGILNTTAVRQVARRVAGQIDFADLVALKHSIRPSARNGATFTIGDDVEETLELQTDSVSRPLFSASVASGPYDRLAGFPYDVSEHMSALGSAGDVLFSAMRFYYVVIEEEVTVARSDEYLFRTNRRAYKCFMNVGARAVQPRVFAVLTPPTPES